MAVVCRRENLEEGIIVEKRADGRILKKGIIVEKRRPASQGYWELDIVDLFPS